MLKRLFSMRLTSFPAPELDHLRYVCMVDGQRAQKILGFTPRFDLEETMEHLRMTGLAMAGLKAKRGPHSDDAKGEEEFVDGVRSLLDANNRDDWFSPNVKNNHFSSFLIF